MEHIKELISEYLDNELSASDRVRVEKHMSVCKECKAYNDEIFQIKNSINHAYDTLYIPSIEEFVLERINEESAFDTFIYRFSWVYLFFGPAFVYLLLDYFQVANYTVRILSLLINFTTNLISIIPLMISEVPYLYVGIIISALLMIITSLALFKIVLTNQRMGVE